MMMHRFKRTKPPVRKTPLQKVSAKQAQRNEKYRQVKQERHDPHEITCQIQVKCKGAVATTEHHPAGRDGDHLFDETIRACVACHLWAETHPEEAKVLNVSRSRLNNE